SRIPPAKAVRGIDSFSHWLCLPQVISNIDINLVATGGGHEKYLGPHDLISEPHRVDRSLPSLRYFFPAQIGEGLTWAHRRTHGTLAHRGSVVAHVALHHLLVFGYDLRNPEGTRKHTIRTCDAARF